jgi:hypothetical protein
MTNPSNSRTCPEPHLLGFARWAAQLFSGLVLGTSPGGMRMMRSLAIFWTCLGYLTWWNEHDEQPSQYQDRPPWRHIAYWTPLGENLINEFRVCVMRWIFWGSKHFDRTFCVCVDEFQGHSKAFHYPIQLLTFYLPLCNYLCTNFENAY